MPSAKDIMTSNVVTIHKDASTQELAELFIQHKVNGIPVVDDEKKLMGIVTEGDLIDQNKNLHIPTVISLFDAVIYLESSQKFEEEVKKLSGTKVEDIYTPNVITVEQNATIDECATIMAEKHVHTLPVMDNGKLIGIIGKLDLIKGLSQQ